MTSASRAPEPSRGPDWEAFYGSYRKPGYIQGFEIGPKLGGGMFGIVFKARKESIGKSYAIKFLRVEDPGVREQVLRELGTVELFAQVDHPNRVSIEDQGVVDGIPYIVMGYAGEETLKDRIEAGPMRDEDALAFFVQAARGVSALHEHSLVHFDLKPANIFLKGDLARVGDYGLSKLVTESAMSLTSGRGTPYYMAPEMLRRRGDHRSDIYSLGVILFECLAGELPFQGANEWEVLRAHEEQAVSFPLCVAEAYRPLIRKALAKRPEDRFDSVAEMLHALRAPAALGESIVFDVPPARAPRSDLSSEQITASLQGAMAIADEAVEEARQRVEETRASSEAGAQGSNWLPVVLLIAGFVLWRRDVALRLGSISISGATILLVAGIWMLWPRASNSASKAASKAATKPARRRSPSRARAASRGGSLLVAFAVTMVVTIFALMWFRGGSMEASFGPDEAVGTMDSAHEQRRAASATSPRRARVGVTADRRARDWPQAISAHEIASTDEIERTIRLLTARVAQAASNGMRDAALERQLAELASELAKRRSNGTWKSEGTGR